MITLKVKVTKSEVLRIMKRKADKMFQHSWQPDMNIESFMLGVNELLKELQVKEKKQTNDR